MKPVSVAHGAKARPSKPDGWSWAGPGIPWHRGGAALLAAMLAIVVTASRAATLTPHDHGRVHALVIGIDTYEHASIPRLHGAVADARDIAGSLGRTGVDDVTLLLDQDATRNTVLTALDRLHATAEPGDLVIITFAGHGTQQAEPRGQPRMEADGLDETWVLWGYARFRPARDQSIIDDELFSHVKQFAARGVEVMVLADSCYGGGMAKSIDPRGGNLSTRGLPRDIEPPDAGDDPRRRPNEGRDEKAIFALPGVTFIGGTEEERTIPEVNIGGHKRGAASYAFAHALEGWADANHDGTTSRGELLGYLRPSVAHLSGSLQRPILLPRLGQALAVPLFRNPAVDVAHADGATPAPDPLRFTVLGARGIGSGPPPPGTAPVPASSPGSPDADLSWDSDTGDALDGSHTVIAYGVPEDGMAGVAERTTAVQQLALLAQGRELELELDPDQDFYIQGEGMHVIASGVAGNYVLVVDIAGTGEVQYVDFDDSLAQGETIAMPIHVQPPYGSDTLAIIATPERNDALEQELRALDKTLKPMALLEALRRHLTHRDDRLGFIVIRTRER